MLNKFLGFLFGLIAVAVLLVAAPVAANADYVTCDDAGVCTTVIGSPPGDPVGADPATGLTPGPVKCVAEDGVQQEDGTWITAFVDVPCSTGPGDWWNNGLQCYLSLSDNATREDPPAGSDTVNGGFYDCRPPEIQPCGGGYCWYTKWFNNPPPGIRTLGPGQAAARIIAAFALTGVDIGIAPDPNVPGAKTYVGVPIWLWVKNADVPLSYAGFDQTTTLGGVTIEVHARVSALTYDMGDGGTKSCGSAGTPYQASLGFTSSPSCGYRYDTVSDNQPGGKFTVRATSQWTIDWTDGNAANGTVERTQTSAPVTVDVNELQSVNVGNN